MLNRYLEFLKANDKSYATVKTYQGELLKFNTWVQEQELGGFLEIMPIDI
jgi:site-specific recombinase XerD